MRKTFKTFMAFALIIVMALSLCACAEKKEASKKGKAKAHSKSGKSVWYMGGNNIMMGDVDVEELFADVEDTIDPEEIYDSTTYTTKMVRGVYTLNNKEEDLKDVRENIPFEEVEFTNGTVSISELPTAVYLGAEHISSQDNNYMYSEYEAITDAEVAVLEFTTKDEVGWVVCTYEIEGKTIIFTDIEKTSEEGEEFAYKSDGIEFKYEFDIQGPTMTLKKGNSRLDLVAYCFSDNNEDELSMSGYSLLDSPLIDELDYFASSDLWNYAVRRDGTYYDLSAFKLTKEGRFTIYLADGFILDEVEEITEQYTYIVQSSCGFLSDFSIVLLDGEKEYYYTDSITQREARVLKDQGTDVDGLTDDEIKEIAEKKSDLYDDLQREFEAQGINVIINRSNGEIAMDASVLFGGDSAVITDDGKALLNKFLAAYTSIIYNENYEGFISKTLVEGHTAPIAGSTYESGLPLSQERANNVKDYCLSADTGVDTSKLASTLEAVGLSNSKPVYGSNGEVDLAACRRVSFKFVVNIEK